MNKYLGNFWKKCPQILITWPIMTSSVTWLKFQNIEKHYLGISMTYHWKEELKGFSTSPKQTSYLNPLTSYGNFSDLPIRRLHFLIGWRHHTGGTWWYMFSYFDRGWFWDYTHPVSRTSYHYYRFYRGRASKAPHPVLGILKMPSLGRVNRSPTVIIVLLYACQLT